MKVKIIADSTSYLNKRLTTFILEYPRYIHSELLTHRLFNKNSGSSRAIPFEKFVENIKTNKVLPIWTENKKGMQGDVIDNFNIISKADDIWEESRDETIKYATKLHELGIHKQNVNRLLEPWMNIKIVLTATEFDNFFDLRLHEDAHPEINKLAELMDVAMKRSTPKFLQPGEWHIPFGDVTIKSPNPFTGGTISMMAIPEFELETILKVSIARCARVSYNNFEGSIDVDKDIELYNKLIVSEPLHASPAEHQGRVPFPNELEHLGSKWKYIDEKWTEVRGKYFSSLSGFIQLRKLIETKEFI